MVIRYELSKFAVDSSKRGLEIGNELIKKLPNDVFTRKRIS